MAKPLAPIWRGEAKGGRASQRLILDTRIKGLIGSRPNKAVIERLSLSRCLIRIFKAQITLDDNHAQRYYAEVIPSFRNAETEALANGRRVKRFESIEAVARRKLRQLQIEGRLEDLPVPPGNRLETLKGDRAGQHSIRVNDQFRVCFRWTAGAAEDVEIVD